MHCFRDQVGWPLVSAPEMGPCADSCQKERHTSEEEPGFPLSRWTRTKNWIGASRARRHPGEGLNIHGFGTSTINIVFTARKTAGEHFARLVRHAGDRKTFKYGRERCRRLRLVSNNSSPQDGKFHSFNNYTSTL